VEIDNRYGDSDVSYSNNFKEFSMLRYEYKERQIFFFIYVAHYQTKRDRFSRNVSGYRSKQGEQIQ